MYEKREKDWIPTQYCKAIIFQIKINKLRRFGGRRFQAEGITNKPEGSGKPGIVGEKANVKLGRGRPCELRLDLHTILIAKVSH